MDTPTIISYLFVGTLAVMGLQYVITTFFCDIFRLKLGIIARHYADGLWLKAYESEQSESRNRLFAMSERISELSAFARENSISMMNFSSCLKEMKEIGDNVEKFKELPIAEIFQNEKGNFSLETEIDCGKVFFVFVTLYALAARYPLSIGIFLLGDFLTHTRRFFS
jgi:hypothetical protein